MDFWMPGGTGAGLGGFLSWFGCNGDVVVGYTLPDDFFSILFD